MKKHATNFLKLLTKRLTEIGLEKVDNNSCQIVNGDCIIQISYFMYYHQKGMRFNSGGDIYMYSPKIDELFKDFNGEDVFMFYYTGKQNHVYLITAPMTWYLPLHYGKDKYPEHTYKYFDKATIIETPEVAVEYFYNELYQNIFLPIKENYGTIALADRKINEEILKTSNVKKANIVYVDHDFHCMRSLLFAYMNNNPNLSQLIEICNAEMENLKKEKPENNRIKIYDYIVEQISRKR